MPPAAPILIVTSPPGSLNYILRIHISSSYQNHCATMPDYYYILHLFIIIVASLPSFDLHLITVSLVSTPLFPSALMPPVTPRAVTSFCSPAAYWCALNGARRTKPPASQPSFPSPASQVNALTPWPPTLVCCVQSPPTVGKVSRCIQTVRRNHAPFLLRGLLPRLLSTLLPRLRSALLPRLHSALLPRLRSALLPRLHSALLPRLHSAALLPATRYPLSQIEVN